MLLLAFIPLIFVQGTLGMNVNPFIHPQPGETIYVNATYIVKWEPTTRGPVSLTLCRLIPGRKNEAEVVLSWQIFNTGFLTWHVDDSLTKVWQDEAFYLGMCGLFTDGDGNGNGNGKGCEYSHTFCLKIKERDIEMQSSSQASSKVPYPNRGNVPRGTDAAEVAQSDANGARKVKMGIVIGMVVVGGIVCVGGGLWVWRRKVGGWDGGGEKDERFGRGVWV